MEIYHVLGGRINIVKMTVLLKAIYDSMQSLSEFFSPTELEQKFLISYVNTKDHE